MTFLIILMQLTLLLAVALLAARLISKDATWAHRVLLAGLVLLFAGRIKTRFISYAVLGFCSFTLAMGIWYLGHAVIAFINNRPLSRLPEWMPIMLIFGSFFAPLWAGAIPVLYNFFIKNSASKSEDSADPQPIPEIGEDQ